MPHELVWFIFFLPLFSFLVIIFVIKPFLNHYPQLSGYLTIAAIAGSLALSVWALLTVNALGHKLPLEPTNWVIIGDVTIKLGLMVDSLTAVMLIVVTLVSLMVQIYSQGYMHGDPSYSRYFAFMSLFTASMLGMVLAGNLLMVYAFWELVGVCSYLLIGFWFHRPAAAAAAKKAFIVTRLGDFGFLMGILLLYFNTGTFDISELHQLAIAGALGGTTLTLAAIGIFSGAVGKSAQFPLHVWLPDAMEGPTPVSALIHAATMVAAGVYLVARLFPLFAHSETALITVAIIGGFTCIFAASMALVMTDIKRVLAYSTISQLGYMMLGLGTGSMAVGIFHLFNHAFFKALLFLGAGSVNHATGTFDMREMGGLRRVMPWTFITFLLASLSIAGIWPLSGFWSKDEILIHAWEHRPILFYLAMITVFMTAFYMFRVVFLTFGGEYRGGKHSESHQPHLHESPPVMTIPLILLSILAVVSGWLNVTGWFSHFLLPHEHIEAHGVFGALLNPLALVSLALAILGMFLAYAMYSKNWVSAESIRRTLSPLHTILSNKYWLDELYVNVIVFRVLVNGFFALLAWFDTYIVDGVVNGIAKGTIGASTVIRRLQTGQVQAYGLAIFLGLLAIAAGFLVFVAR